MVCEYRPWYEKARKHMCVTDRHDMTLVVKVALKPNTTNQPTWIWFICQFTAQIRLPDTYTVAQKKERVEEIIETLDLKKCEDTSKWDVPILPVVFASACGWAEADQ